jgi:hypothetical protein
MEEREAGQRYSSRGNPDPRAHAASPPITQRNRGAVYEQSIQAPCRPISTATACARDVHRSAALLPEAGISGSWNIASPPAN